MIPLDAMKQALEALEEANPNLSPNGRADRLVNESITNLRTAIDELESAAPVAWMGVYNEHDLRDMRTVVMRYREQFRSEPPDRMFPLFTHPSPNAGELDLLRTQVRELRLQRDVAEKERDEVRTLNKALIKNRMNAAEEHANLIELLEQATSYTCCSAYSPSLTRKINAALAKVGEKL